MVRLKSNMVCGLSTLNDFNDEKNEVKTKVVVMKGVVVSGFAKSIYWDH